MRTQILPLAAVISLLFSGRLTAQFTNLVEYTEEEIPVPGVPVGFNDNGVVLGQQDFGFYVYSNGVATFPDLRAKVGNAMMIPLCLTSDDTVFLMPRLDIPTEPDRTYYIYKLASGELKKITMPLYWGTFPNHPRHNDIGHFLDGSADWVFVGEESKQIPESLRGTLRPSAINNHDTVVASTGVAGAFMLYRGGAILETNFLQIPEPAGADIAPCSINSSETVLFRVSRSTGCGFYVWRDGESYPLLGRDSESCDTVAMINDNDVVVTCSGTLLCVFQRERLVYSRKSRISTYGKTGIYTDPWFGAVVLNNRDEILVGKAILRPKMPLSLTANRAANGSVQLGVTGEPNAAVQVQSSTNLSTWTPYQTLKVGVTPATVTDPGDSPQKFFKAQGQ